MKGERREGHAVNVRYYSRDVDIALIDRSEYRQVGMLVGGWWAEP